MKKFKQQLSKIINKVKSSRSLQIKFAMVVGALLLYHYLFGDIGNWNVKIESYTQKITNRDSIYSVFLENDKLKVHEYSRDDLSEKYCKGVADYYRLRRVVSFDPMVVECRVEIEAFTIIITNGLNVQKVKYYDRSYIRIEDDELAIPANIKLTITEIENKYCKQFNLKLRKILNSNPMKVVCGHSDSEVKTYVTNGKWIYIFENYDIRIVGQNEQYLILEDYSLINKMTGETMSSITNLKIIGVATVSKNKIFFVSQYHDWGDSVAKVNKNGNITKLQEFYTSLTLNIPSVKSMRVSDDGKYLYIVVAKQQRGSNNHLVFYIIEINSKSIIFKKTLERNKVSFGNLYMNKQQENILLIYRLNRTLKTFKIFHKTKKEN